MFCVLKNDFVVPQLSVTLLQSTKSCNIFVYKTRDIILGSNIQHNY